MYSLAGCTRLSLTFLGLVVSLATGRQSQALDFQYAFGSSYLKEPTDVAVFAPGGRGRYVLVSDKFDNTVHGWGLTASGLVLSNHWAFDLFDSPVAIAVNDIPEHDNYGQVYTLSDLGDRAEIDVWTLGGSFIQCHTSFEALGATGMTLDNQGNVYVSDRNGCLKFDASHFNWVEECFLLEADVTYSGGLDRITDVAVDAFGVVYAPDTCDCLWAFNNNGTSLWTSSSGGAFAPRIAATYVDAHDADASIWILTPDFGGQTMRVRFEDRFNNDATYTIDGSAATRDTGALNLEFRRFWNLGWVIPGQGRRVNCNERLFVVEAADKQIAVFGQKGSSTALPSSCTAWWQFSEIGTGDVYDLIGGNTGSFSGAPQRLEGMVGNGLHFETEADGVSVPSSSSLNFGSGSFSIEAWIRTRTTGNRAILDKRRSSPYQGYHLFLYGDRVGFQLASNGSYENLVSSVSATDARWHCIVVVVDRTSSNPGVRLYQDGALVAEDKTPVQGSVDNTAPLLMADHISQGSSGYLGDLDEVTLYRKALNESEIGSICNAGCAGKNVPWYGGLMMFLGW